MQLMRTGISIVAASLIISVLTTALGYAKSPDCTGPNRYPASVAFVYLKNAGITTNNKVDFDKTKVMRLASEKIGKDLYRQVHYIVFTEKSGVKIDVITVNDASSEECSMSGVEVFIVAKHFGKLY